MVARPDVSTYYTVTHPAQQTADWRAFYHECDRRTLVTRGALEHKLDIPYGPHEKQRLDVYLPSASPAAAPVFVFVHGGGFVEGDRAHYGFVAEPFAAAGAVTIVPGYRLLPDFSYPDAVDDVRDVLAWVAQHAPGYGGRTDGVVVGGHSAGGILAAAVAADTTWISERALPEGLIGGWTPVSAGYDFTVSGTASFVGKRLGSERARRKASPLWNIRAPVTRAVVAVGGRETAYVEASRTFTERLTANGVRADLLVLDGLGHDGTVLSLGDAGSELCRAALVLLRS